MFALLAMAGDLGGAFGPGLVGNITQHAENDLKKGMLAACVFPLVLLISLFLLKSFRRDKAKEKTLTAIQNTNCSC